MNAIRRTAGLGIILLASAMMILCLAGIVGVWLVKGRVDAIGDGIFKAADNSLEFMDEKLDRIEIAFKNGNRRIGLISNAVNHLPEKGAEIKTGTISLLKSLDEEVFEPLKTAETWIDSTQAVAVGVGKISEAMVTSEYAASHKDSMGVEMAERLQSCSESLVEILTNLQEVRQGLIDIRDDLASARRIAARVVARLAQIETRMANLCKRIEGVHTRIIEMKGAVSDQKDRFQWWTMFGAVLISLFLGWFAASQIGMILHGFPLVRRRL
jgi:septation ring formation regulator EzrA